MTETIFSKIIRGEVPCHKVYEDDLVLAFLDVAPLARGHVLVIPKRACRTLDELDEDSAAAIGRLLPRLCRAIKRVTGSYDYNVLQNNGALAHQAVDHVHFHLIPKPSKDKGLGIKWPAAALDPEDGAELSRRLVEVLGE